MPEDIIKITNLSKIYDRKTEVFRSFNYVINKRLFLLIGPNGSGKTTLLNCITNYISYKGQIIKNGRISYLPELRDFDEDVISKDLINLMNKMYNVDLSIYVKRITFSSYLNTKISDLSKGNRTKLFILCTLAKPADIYIFDEPTDGLDIKAKNEFVEFCNDLSRNKGVVVSTHDLGVINLLNKNAQLLDLGVVKHV